MEPTSLDALAVAHGWATQLVARSSPHLGQVVADGVYVPGGAWLCAYRDGLRAHVILSEDRDGSWRVSYLTVCRRPPDIPAEQWPTLDDGPYGRPDHCFAHQDPAVFTWPTARLVEEIERAQVTRDARRRLREGEHNPWRERR
jgi:hypothetical protein